MCWTCPESPFTPPRDWRWTRRCEFSSLKLPFSRSGCGSPLCEDTIILWQEKLKAGKRRWALFLITPDLKYYFYHLAATLENNFTTPTMSFRFRFVAFLSLASTIAFGNYLINIYISLV